LNDEVINFFMNLLKERDDALVAAAVAKGEERRKNWFFNSFFISKLLDDDKGYKYANVKRWSRKAGDLFTYDKVFFPVNIGNSHWCLAVIHMQTKKIQYFDSLVGTGREYLPHLRRYLQDEHQDKKKAALDLSGWELVYSDRQVVPQQANGADCGCFASAFAYLLSEGLPIKYISQADMPAFRQRLVMSIIKKALTW
jgi:sentrin-specific protease 1